MTKADRYMKETIRRILDEGYWDKDPRPQYADGTPAHTISINHVLHSYDLSKNEFPITTLRPIKIKKAINEILWIYQWQSNSLEILEDILDIKWWRPWESKDVPGTIGQRYGATVKRHNLMNRLLDGIKNNPYGRRHIMSLWQNTDFEMTDGLMPCCFLTIWNVRGEYLDMCLIQRSSDWLTAGNINQIQYVALQMMVAKHCGYKPGVFTHFIANVQIYDRHVEQAEEMLKRKSQDVEPVFTLDITKDNFYEFTYEDFILTDYNPTQPQLKFELGI